MRNQVDEEPRQLGHAGADPASTTVIALGEAQCWSHLRSQSLGRVAIALDGQPLVFPVNYAVNKDSIVFRTAAATMLRRAVGLRACFEIDHHDPSSREGWSVMATGTIDDITDADDPHSEALRGLPVRPLAPGIRPYYIAMQATRVTGRQFTAGWFVPGNWLG